MQTALTVRGCCCMPAMVRLVPSSSTVRTCRQHKYASQTVADRSAHSRVGTTSPCPDSTAQHTPRCRHLQASCLCPSSPDARAPPDRTLPPCTASQMSTAGWCPAGGEGGAHAGADAGTRPQCHSSSRARSCPSASPSAETCPPTPTSVRTPQPQRPVWNTSTRNLLGRWVRRCRRGACGSKQLKQIEVVWNTSAPSLLGCWVRRCRRGAVSWEQGRLWWLQLVLQPNPLLECKDCKTACAGRISETPARLLGTHIGAGVTVGALPGGAALVDHRPHAEQLAVRAVGQLALRCVGRCSGVSAQC